MGSCQGTSSGEMELPTCAKQLEVFEGLAHRWRKESAQTEGGKKHSASSLVAINSSWESNGTALRYCFLPCTVACRELPTGSPPQLKEGG